jgi:hypothetical protein
MNQTQNPYPSTTSGRKWLNQATFLPGSLESSSKGLWTPLQARNPSSLSEDSGFFTGDPATDPQSGRFSLRDGGSGCAGVFPDAGSSADSVSEKNMRTCPRCGESRRVDEFARDVSKRSGRKSICKGCDRVKAAAYYAANREAVAARTAARRPSAEPRFCSECFVLLEGRRRVVCSSRCSDARYRRLHPETYAELEARKVVRRREARREQAKARRARTEICLRGQADQVPPKNGAA